MKKLRLLESMLGFSLLACVVGFGLGVLAVCYAAPLMFDFHPRSTLAPARISPAGDAGESAGTDRASERKQRLHAGQAAGQSPAAGSDQAPALTPVVPAQSSGSPSQWPLLVVGILAGLGVFLLVFLAWLQVKLVLGAQAVVPKPSANPKQAEPAPVAVARPVAETNGHTTLELLERLAGSLDQLDGRIEKLEHTPAPSQNPVTFSHAREGPHEAPPAPVAPAAPAAPVAPVAPVAAVRARPPSSNAADETEAAKLRLGRSLRTRRLLANGEALLIAENAKRALECFEEALALDPGSAEVQIKKGNALERLGRLEEALEAYDRAIALDGSATMAYLFKGGVCNRLDRYEEALQCYQQALGGKPEPAPR
jgi:hypothetical protein